MAHQIAQEMMANPRMIESVMAMMPAMLPGGQQLLRSPMWNMLLNNPQLMHQSIQQMYGVAGPDASVVGAAATSSSSASSSSTTSTSETSAVAVAESDVKSAATGTGVATATNPDSCAAGAAGASNAGAMYRSQLRTLHDMGFVDEDRNLGALVATGGNVEAAIVRIEAACAHDESAFASAPSVVASNNSNKGTADKPD